ncbi:phosphotransferase [Nocardioides solisilvae]|uniref:phosphotransferase n=1 Tax=Nocardioides solisilvae TaxID=1542435 RepID=UPI0013A55657|nr:phosphotransferase [Nocardioides solisilvae]
MTAPPSADVLDLLRATVLRLWPGASAEVVRARRPDPTAEAELLLLPHARSPRLLLPVLPAAAAGSVRRWSATAGPAEVGARALASAVLQAGGTRLLADRLRVHRAPAARDADESLAAALARWLDVPATAFSLGVGPARVNRKPVLQLFDPRGRTLGFAKLGDSPTAARHVREETAALRVLAGADLTTLRAPALLHAGTWRDVDVLVQEDLRVGPVAALARRPGLLGRAAAELTTAYAEDARPLTALPWWAGLLDRARTAPDRATTDRLVRAADRVAARWPGPLPVSAWHGDWTPWNMAPGRGRDGGPALLVWDWERFETGVPAGLDAVHFAVNAATRRLGTSARVVREALGGAGAVEAAYLVAVTARYLEMSAAPGGALVVPRALATLEALESLLADR